MSERRRLLFLHTGGTLGMTSTGPGPLSPGHYENTVLPYVRGLEQIASIEGRVVCSIDSSDMHPGLWEELAEHIALASKEYDGFVVLHGTDTMAYTAAALSYMLHGLDRPVILTGSQRPISATRTDARSNLVHSAICATMQIPEVGLYFGNALFRGNRATKVSTQAYNAFASPNHPPLLTMGVDVHRGEVLPPPENPLTLRTGFARDVAVLTLFPGIHATVLERVADHSRAILLRGFGEGNVPLNGWPETIARVTERGVTVVLMSQCRKGAVRAGRYQGSSEAAHAGAVFAGDLTGEAALVKLMWLLGQGADQHTIRAELLSPLAGECAQGDQPIPARSPR